MKTTKEKEHYSREELWKMQGEWCKQMEEQEAKRQGKFHVVYDEPRINVAKSIETIAEGEEVVLDLAKFAKYGTVMSAISTKNARAGRKVFEAMGMDNNTKLRVRRNAVLVRSEECGVRS